MASTSYLKAMMERFKEDLAKRKPEAIKKPPKSKKPKKEKKGCSSTSGWLH